MKSNPPAHFMLIKLSGYSAEREELTGYRSALKLLEAGMWPLWSRTRCKYQIAVGHQLLVYIGGNELFGRRIVATAEVASVECWQEARHRKRYPLMLDGEPDRVLNLQAITLLEKPVDIMALLDQLSFVPANRQKWGVALMGGCRPLTADDYELLKSGGQRAGV